MDYQQEAGHLFFFQSSSSSYEFELFKDDIKDLNSAFKILKYTAELGLIFNTLDEEYLHLKVSVDALFATNKHFLPRLVISCFCATGVGLSTS